MSPRKTLIHSFRWSDATSNLVFLSSKNVLRINVQSNVLKFNWRQPFYEIARTDTLKVKGHDITASKL